jgi:hypothetical protein
MRENHSGAIAEEKARAAAALEAAEASAAGNMEALK